MTEMRGPIAFLSLGMLSLFGGFVLWGIEECILARYARFWGSERLLLGCIEYARPYQTGAFVLIGIGIIVLVIGFMLLAFRK